MPQKRFTGRTDPIVVDDAAGGHMQVVIGGQPAITTTTIANGQTVSADIDLGDAMLTHIALPAAWTGTAISFDVSFDDGVTWHALHGDDGAQISIPCAAGRALAVPFTALSAVRRLRVVSDTAEAAERTLTLVTMPL